MRPRSRLLSKRRLLLPTIREGTEETLRDMNEANALHSQSLSSEDYLLSICHLAHPTFPTRDAPTHNIHTRQLEAVHERLRVSQHGGKTSSGSRFNCTEEDQRERDQQELSVELMFGKSDPLEFLYGHENNLSGGVRRVFVEGKRMGQRGSVWEGRARSRAHSIPHASSPVLPRERKSSCPEVHTGTNTLVPNISPKHRFSRLEAQRRSPVVRGAEGENQKSTIKLSFISQWISDCRSAWREVRARACMLPAITEM
ncbi:uncharacterized protein si:dkeyp-72g9.4 [Solea solea]|uniref:uncharacterized protein si:dkeyp-72g9.4 n=1 Tax=Solea solea TaxID=90069 RepID=UPI00272A5D1B|nr:uncharacterized protein si:dkeyp-72g9.4 [Solea solea]